MDCRIEMGRCDLMGIRGCSCGADPDQCDSCESYWKAEGEDPPCVEERMEKIARIMAWKYLLNMGASE